MAEWILGIETSCDETSAAVLRRSEAGTELAGLSILSQDVHRIFGGVVPELAARDHLEAAITMCRAMDMPFWLEQSEQEWKALS